LYSGQKNENKRKMLIAIRVIIYKVITIVWEIDGRHLIPEFRLLSHFSIRGIVCGLLLSDVFAFLTILKPRKK